MRRYYWIGVVLLTLCLLIAVAMDEFIFASDKYRFELVDEQRAGPSKTDITLRLVHVPDEKPVIDAVLLKTHLGAAMAEAPGNIRSLPSDEPGLYRFQVETVVAGKWTLHLAAKVRGELEPVNGTISFDAVK